MSEVIVETRDLSIRFGGVLAVNNVNFSLRAREMRCLIGPNGAGKSTLLRVISRLIEASSGSMQMQGPWTRRRLSRSCVWRRYHAAWGWREARLASLFFHCEVGRFFCCESLLRGHFFRHSHY